MGLYLLLNLIGGTLSAPAALARWARRLLIRAIVR